jgi:large subunit ribosomal protein L21
MGYAIIESGGRQLRVEVGRFYDLDLLYSSADDDRVLLEEGASLSFDRVLLVRADEESLTVGTTLCRRSCGQRQGPSPWQSP